jgi:P-type E1-E2 ATPase
MVNVLVLDKTGTLTAPSSKIITVLPLDKRYKPETILQLAASVQKKWPHPLSRAVVRKAKEVGLPLLACKQNEMIPGRGVRGTIKDREILVGSLRFVEERFVPRSSLKELQKQNNNVDTGNLFVAAAGHLIGTLQTKSKLQGNIERSLKQIRDMGIKHIVLLTGDNQRGTELILKRPEFV